MESFANREFWKAYRQLPAWVRKRAREAYRLFEFDPRHPSLHFKRVHSRLPVFSARITLDQNGRPFADAEEEDRAYWHSLSPQERLSALEKMRQLNYDYDPAADRIQRTLEVAQQS